VIYEEHILEHYRHPRNKGDLPGADFKFMDTNPLCGDEITVRFKTKNGVITAARFEATGCAISQAAASMLFEQLEGEDVADILKKDKHEVLSEFGELSVSRIKCALLPLTAVKKALVEHARD
jgi:nitrogen fixation NifU-like protein